MRTVHETEALRPSDPVPKHHSSNPAKPQRLRLIINKNGAVDKSLPASPAAGQSSSNNPDSVDYGNNNISYVAADSGSPTDSPRIRFPPDIHFTEHELSLPATELFRLLRRQEHWAVEEAEELKAQIDDLEKQRFEEWMRKELVLENGFEADLFRMMRMKQEMGVDVDGLWPVLDEDLGPARKLEYKGGQPWWREPVWVKDGPMPDTEMQREEDAE
jgi:hypothetical protein